ncbi:hypothetical protein D3C81_1945170 [compost metagenome]
MGLFLSDLAQAWHEVQQGKPKQRHPGNERQHQLQGKTARQGDDGDEVHADAGGDFDQGEQHFAYGKRGLHHLGGHTSGKLVRKERKALPQHQAMEVPA